MNDLVCQNELMESTLCQSDFLSTLGWSPIHSQTYAQPAPPPDPIFVCVPVFQQSTTLALSLLAVTQPSVATGAYNSRPL